MKPYNIHCCVKFPWEDADEIEHIAEVEFEYEYEVNEFESVEDFRILYATLDGKPVPQERWKEFENQVFEHADGWQKVEDCEK